MASYNVNYNDKRFTQVESQKNAALKESDKTYDQMIKDSDKYYSKQIDAVETWGETQKKNQQAQTDFVVEQIEQQKDQAYKDFQKEGSAAYVDWRKQTNEYGTNAEKMADMGLAHSGYSEQSKVAMYNTYQNRVATARESYNRAVLNYDNAIKDARLQNSSALAEIAYNTLQQSLELSLQGFQYKNTLVLEKANKKAEINDRYYTRYQNVLSQINHENSMAEQIRQYNQSYALDLKKYNESVRQYNESLALQKAQLEEEKRQYNETLALQKKKSNVSSGSSGSSGSGGGGGKIEKDEDEPKKTPTKTPTNTKTKTKEPEVDMKSVTALGYGPISASKLDSLVASGKVIEYESNGKLKYKKVLPATNISTYMNASNLPSSVKKKLGLK